MEPRLHNAQKISRRFQLRMHTKMPMLEEWRWTKASTITLTTSTFPILGTLNPCHFLVSHYAIDYLECCFDHFITLFSYLNWLTMRSKVDVVYNILSFVRNCTLNWYRNFQRSQRVTDQTWKHQVFDRLCPKIFLDIRQACSIETLLPKVQTKRTTFSTQKWPNIILEELWRKIWFNPPIHATSNILMHKSIHFRIKYLSSHVVLRCSYSGETWAHLKY